ncbi:MAG: ABC transporter permease [Bacteroidetes bacterium HGW-Bacteroidetes-4]|jgi:putative ABC transport system permease protein|nr:MAG: ABC transporter permease [Bacteroidetes bacterium HGW-Bacteroidetes-4]
MFDLDKWQEIFATLQKNKLRTFLTSFSVAWGILLLIILLGSGKGLQNAVMQNFESNAKNAVWIWPGRTSMEYKGLSRDREIRFTNKDFEIIRDQIAGIDNISPQFNIWGGTRVTYNNEFGNFTVQCVLPEHQPIEGSKVLQGRYLNKIDIQQRRKVVVIGEEVFKALFKGEDPIGKFIKVNNISFKVIGVYSDGNGWQNRRVVMPFTAAQQIFNGGVNVSSLGLTTGDATPEESKIIEDKIRQKLASIHTVNPEDKSAIGIRNTLTEFSQTQKVFLGIRMFIWFIGIGTLIAGIVGVSNIMLIVVKERTREIGVRKALGATPASILGLIISEAVFITTLAGYVGMVIGVAIMEGVDFVMDQSIANAQQTTDAAGQIVLFLNPNADIGIAVGATILLVVCGALAGMIPALKAARIKPIESLRYE